MKKTIMTLVLLASFLTAQNASAAITSSLDLGSTGSDVTELQTYLATNASLYPSGLVTGYFGLLTQAGVQRFQAAQGIVSAGTPATTGYGRVGPTTMARINSLLGFGGFNNQVSRDPAPMLSSLSIQTNDDSAVFSWSTNELAQGQVYYDNVPLRSDEATGPGQRPYVSGSLVSNNGNQVNHSLTLQNLQSDTVYYYLTRAIDNAGNITMTWPNSFRTE